MQLIEASSLRVGMMAMKRAGLRKADWRLHLGCIEVTGKGLTPTHLFLQLEPSWFRNGQTTSLLESVMEKDDVKDDRGGILTPPALSRASERGWGGRLRAVLRCDKADSGWWWLS